MNLSLLFPPCSIEATFVYNSLFSTANISFVFSSKLFHFFSGDFKEKIINTFTEENVYALKMRVM